MPVPRTTPRGAAPLQIRSTRLWEGLLDVVSVIAVVSAVGRTEPVPLGALAVLAVAGVGLAVRRRLPALAVVAATAASTVGGFCWPDATWSTLALWVMAQTCLFSVALRSDRRVAAGAAGTLAVTLVAQSTLAQSNSVLDLLSFALLTWTAAVLGAGLAVRAQRDHVAALEAAQRAETRDREREVGRRLTQERLRIARDLHDAVAHTVSVISLHAGAAERNLRSAPDDAVASLGAIRTAARTVVGEMQQILTVLREEGDVGAGADRTVPGMAAVPDLVRSVRASGVQVSYAEQIGPGDLPQALDVTVYRVLQEALTNAVRYGDGAVDVSIRQDESTLSVRVANGRGSAQGDAGGASASDGAGAGSGFGLVGMQERVSAAGGRLRVDDTAHSFEVLVDLPTESTRQPA